MPWSSSTRRQRLPKDWPRRRQAVLTRDQHQCQIRRPGCTTAATEVDHIVPSDDHALANLQAACSDCHKLKTRDESRAARNARPKPTRSAERHPGLMR